MASGDAVPFEQPGSSLLREPRSAVLGLKPAALLPLLIIWLIVVMLSGFVGLATMIATATFPAYVALAGIEPARALLTFGCVMLLFVCYTHRANIERMRAGTENRARSLWLLRRR